MPKPLSPEEIKLMQVEATLRFYRAAVIHLMTNPIARPNELPLTSIVLTKEIVEQYNASYSSTFEEYPFAYNGISFSIKKERLVS